jgi:hypothetical protein
MAIHGIVPTNVRLSTTLLTDTGKSSIAERQHSTMPQWLGRETGVLRRYAPMDSFATDDRPATYTKRMSSLSLFQSMASTKTLGNLVVLGECFVMRRNGDVHCRYWTTLTWCAGQSCRYIRDAKDATSGEIFVGVLGSPETGKETGVLAEMWREQKEVSSDCDRNWRTAVRFSSCVAVLVFLIAIW